MPNIREVEFNLQKPALYEELKWVAYGEGRRDPAISDSLTGNGTEADLLLETAYEFTSSHLPKETWLAKERYLARQRITALRQYMGIIALGRPRPDHGTNYIDLDKDMNNVRDVRPSTHRLHGDATVTETPGFGSVFTPADCPIINLVEPRCRAIAQIHAGYDGMSKGVIPVNMDRFTKAYDFAPQETLAYVSPHAISNYEVYGDVLTRLSESVFTRDHLETLNGRTYLRMGQLVFAQLSEAGVAENHIEISTDDSFTDPTLYSQRNYRQKRTNGRNPIAIGIRKI
jgi:copper oxidase (laccase) domain-containing protein